MPKHPADDALFAALEKASLSDVDAALKAGASLDAKKGKDGVLQYALKHRAPNEFMLALIDKGADVTPIRDRIVSAIGQPMHVLEKFLAAGADPNTQTFSGTPVQVAARMGRLDQVERLLQAGADPNGGTMIGNALTDAAMHGHTECAIALLRAGATPAKAEQYMPLVPIQIELGNDALVAALVEAGADVNTRYTLRGPHSRKKLAGRGEALSGIARALSGGVPDDDDDEDDDDESVEDFEKRMNAQVNASIESATAFRLSGVTPLIVAVLEGNETLVDLFLARGADVNAADDQGRTALAIASAAKNEPIAAKLRAKGASADAGAPPALALYLAAASGDVAGIEKALERGADLAAYDTRTSSDGRTALILAVENGQPAAVAALVARGADLEQKAKSSRHNVQAFLDSCSQERTALHVAAERGNTDVLRALLAGGASVAARDENKETPLHLAAAENRAEVVPILVEAGAEVDAKGRDSMTPLLYACARGHAEAGLALLQAGASAVAANRAKESTLHYAVGSRCVPLVKALFEAGADPDAKNKYGTPARERGEHVTEIKKVFDSPRPKPGRAKPPAKAKKPKK
jgi:ankyrin repeat protein